MKDLPEISPRIATLLNSHDLSCFVGLDEVGRGPLAGPVVAGAVMLRDNHGISGLNDSKMLTEKTRDAIAPIIKERCPYGLGWVWPDEIEKINIHNASLLAMERAYVDLIKNFPLDAQKILFALVDGLHLPHIDCERFAQVKGDALLPSISAASIIAKTARDAYMVEQDTFHPGYNFSKHKGYATALHRKMILELGPSPIHRHSFLKNLLHASSSENLLPFETL